MVAAILIPIIIFYFYFVTKREKKVHEQQWLMVASVKEQAIVFGKVFSLTEEKQRYYQNKYVYVTDILLKDQSKSFRIRRVVPVKEDFVPPQIKVGDIITCFGTWDDNYFKFTRFEHGKRSTDN